MTGGTDGPTRPPHGDDADSPSAPWERPSRWASAAGESDASSIEELLRQITATGPAAGSRRRRRESVDADATAVSASELIAALTGGGDEAPGDAPGGDGEPGGAPSGDEAPDRETDDAGDTAVSADAGALPVTSEPAADDPSGNEVVDPAHTAGLEDTGFDSTGEAPPVDPNSWETVRESLHREILGAPVFAPPALAALDGDTGHDDAEAGDEPGDSAQPADDPERGAGAEPAADESDVRMTQPPPRDGTAPPEHADGPHRRWWIAGRAAIAFVAVVTLLLVGTYWVIKHRADSVIADRQVSAVVPDDSNIVTPPSIATQTTGPSAQIPVANKDFQPENILLLGSDTRSTKEDAKLGGSGTTTMQSDVLMVLHISADRSHVSIVSIPRDLYIDAPTCKAWDYRTNTLSDVDYDNPYSEWKITNAYSVGGPQCTVRAVQQLSGLRIDRVIIIDFAGFKSMVDALHGITVNICRPIIDGNLGTVIPKAGEIHINGTQALKLVRAREVRGDKEADLARIRRQQKVLSTMLREVTSAGVLLDPKKLDDVLQAFVHSVQTDNVSFDDLVNIAQSLGSLDPKHVTFYTLPTVPAPGTSGLNPAPVAPLVWQALRRDEPLPGEQTGPTTTTTPTAPTKPSPTPTPVTELVTQLVTSTPSEPQVITVAPGDVDLQVVNVAGRGGVATQAMNKLTPSGFQLAQADLLLVPGDVRSGITVEFAPDNRAAALTVAAAVPGATLKPTDGLGSKVRLLLGTDFDGTIRTVAVGDSLPAALSTSVEPVVSTVVSTIVTTPPAPTTSTSTPPTTSSTSGTTSGTLGTNDVQLHNAANASCI